MNVDNVSKQVTFDTQPSNDNETESFLSLLKTKPEVNLEDLNNKLQQLENKIDKIITILTH